LKINFCDNYCFQQDDTTVLIAKMVKEFLTGNGIKNPKWSARSLCMNISKDVWRMISDLVYSRPQYQDIKFLEKSIIETIFRQKGKYQRHVRTYYTKINSYLG